MKTKITLLAMIASMLGGCAWYQQSPLTPDSFNVTQYVPNDGKMSEGQTGVGFNWPLKK